MLDNIQSASFIGKLFSFIEDKRKMKSIKYAKKIQTILDITLFDYKYFSGRYIIYEENNKSKGKEYLGHNDELIFEGEYIKGERNGKGKEYNYLNGKVIFEGEYLNGKRNGKGKEYDYSGGNLIFEGEYLRGDRWNGKGYDAKGNLAYELTEGKGLVKEHYDTIIE